MVTLEDVERIVVVLPEVTEGVRYGRPTWFVGKRFFAWERPFSKADLKRFGDTTPPSEPILAVRVADLHEKEAVLTAGAKGFFSIAHFDGFAAVLIELRVAQRKAVTQAIEDAWLACAPAHLAQIYLAEHRASPTD